MMEAVLILNSDCSISALCEVEQYLSFEYRVEMRAIFKVSITSEHFAEINQVMWEEKRSVYVVTPTTVHLVPDGERYCVLHRQELLELIS